MKKLTIILLFVLFSLVTMNLKAQLSYPVGDANVTTTNYSVGSVTTRNYDNWESFKFRLDLYLSNANPNNVSVVEFWNMGQCEPFDSYTSTSTVISYHNSNNGSSWSLENVFEATYTTLNADGEMVCVTKIWTFKSNHD